MRKEKLTWSNAIMACQRMDPLQLSNTSAQLSDLFLIRFDTRTTCCSQLLFNFKIQKDRRKLCHLKKY